MELDYAQAFENLTDKEKMYTYYLFKAIAAGWRVILFFSLSFSRLHLSKFQKSLHISFPY